jgi:hypothetical protein
VFSNPSEAGGIEFGLGQGLCGCGATFWLGPDEVQLLNVWSLKSHQVDATIMMILVQAQGIRAMTAVTNEFGRPRGGLSAPP